MVICEWVKSVNVGLFDYSFDSVFGARVVVATQLGRTYHLTKPLSYPFTSEILPSTPQNPVKRTALSEKLHQIQMTSWTSEEFSPFLKIHRTHDLLKIGTQRHKEILANAIFQKSISRHESKTHSATSVTSQRRVHYSMCLRWDLPRTMLLAPSQSCKMTFATSFRSAAAQISQNLVGWLKAREEQTGQTPPALF